MKDETEISNELFKKIKSLSIIDFPKYRLPVIKEEELFVPKKSPNIFFKNGEIYDKNSKINTFLKKVYIIGHQDKNMMVNSRIIYLNR